MLSTGIALPQASSLGVCRPPPAPIPARWARGCREVKQRHVWSELMAEIPLRLIYWGCTLGLWAERCVGTGTEACIHLYHMWSLRQSASSQCTVSKAFSPGPGTVCLHNGLDAWDGLPPANLPSAECFKWAECRNLPASVPAVLHDAGGRGCQRQRLTTAAPKAEPGLLRPEVQGALPLLLWVFWVVFFFSCVCDFSISGARLLVYAKWKLKVLECFSPVVPFWKRYVRNFASGLFVFIFYFFLPFLWLWGEKKKKATTYQVWKFRKTGIMSHWSQINADGETARDGSPLGTGKARCNAKSSQGGPSAGGSCSVYKILMERFVNTSVHVNVTP